MCSIGQNLQTISQSNKPKYIKATVRLVLKNTEEQAMVVRPYFVYVRSWKCSQTCTISLEMIFSSDLIRRVVTED